MDERFKTMYICTLYTHNHLKMFEILMVQVSAISNITSHFFVCFIL